MTFFVRSHAPNRRMYLFRLGIAHISITILAHNGVHVQLGVGTDSTTRFPGLEFIAGISHWAKKGTA